MAEELKRGLCSVSRNVCYVNSNGVLNWNDCDYENGVRPFWWFVRTMNPFGLQGEFHIKREYNPSRMKMRDKYKRLWMIFKNLLILVISIILTWFL